MSNHVWFSYDSTLLRIHPAKVEPSAQDKPWRLFTPPTIFEQKKTTNTSNSILVYRTMNTPFPVPHAQALPSGDAADDNEVSPEVAKHIHGAVFPKYYCGHNVRHSIC